MKMKLMQRDYSNITDLLLRMSKIKLNSVLRTDNSIIYKFGQPDPYRSYNLLDLDCIVDMMWCFFKLFDLVYKHHGFMKTPMGRNVVVTAKFKRFIGPTNKYVFETTYCTFFSKTKLIDSFDNFMKKCLSQFLKNNKHLAQEYPFRGYNGLERTKEGTPPIPFTDPESKSSCVHIYLISLEIKFLCESKKPLDESKEVDLNDQGKDKD